MALRGDRYIHFGRVRDSRRAYYRDSRPVCADAGRARACGVLAHEMAHVLRKHHLKEITRQAQSELLGDVAQTALSIFTNNSSDAQLVGAWGRQVFAVVASTREYELMSSTHPPTRERIQFLEKMLEKGLDRYEGTLSDNLSFVQMQERLARY